MIMVLFQYFFLVWEMPNRSRFRQHSTILGLLLGCEKFLFLLQVYFAAVLPRPARGPSGRCLHFVWKNTSQSTK